MVLGFNMQWTYANKITLVKIKSVWGSKSPLTIHTGQQLPVSCRPVSSLVSRYRLSLKPQTSNPTITKDEVQPQKSTLNGFLTLKFVIGNFAAL